jgi:hypothetical protein
VRAKLAAKVPTSDSACDVLRAMLGANVAVRLSGLSYVVPPDPAPKPDENPEEKGFVPAGGPGMSFRLGAGRYHGADQRGHAAKG